MKQGMIAWGRSQAPAILVGVGLWILLAVAGHAYAASQNAPVWPTVVTWNEWVAAVLLLPRMTFLALGLRRQDGGKDDAITRMLPWVNRMAWVALVVFLLDLVVRGAYGLGWKPF